jgi:hypothetical protein
MSSLSISTRVHPDDAIVAYTTVTVRLREQVFIRKKGAR